MSAETIALLEEEKRVVEAVDRLVTQLNQNRGRDNDALAQLTTLTTECRALGERLKQLIKDPHWYQVPSYKSRKIFLSEKGKDVAIAVFGAEMVMRRARKDDVARMYRTINPGASEDEVKAVRETQTIESIVRMAVEPSRQEIAATVRQEVENRHKVLQKIEQDIINIYDLFQWLADEVHRQEPIVKAAEAISGNVIENVAGANTELDDAVKKARAARRKKWYCVGMFSMI